MDYILPGNFHHQAESSRDAERRARQQQRACTETASASQHHATPRRHNHRSSSVKSRSSSVHGESSSTRTRSSSMAPQLSRASSTNSAKSARSFRSGAGNNAFTDEMKHQIMVNYLYQQMCTLQWVSEDKGMTEGCIVRKERGQYMACPPVFLESAFTKAMTALNVQCAMTVHSRVIKSFCLFAPEAAEVPLNNGTRIQMVHSMAALSQCKTAQCAAVIADEGILAVWDDDATHLIKRGQEIEEQMMKIIWEPGEDEKQEPAPDNKKKVERVEPVGIDEETGEVLVEKRPIHLQNSVLVGFTLCLIMVSLGAAFRQIATEVHTDGYWPRIALSALMPIQIFFTLFFAQVIFGSFAQLIGPIHQMEVNSKYFSAKLPPRLESHRLPHVTIQCPVYKEGLQGVIAPTVRSLKEAMTTYERQGGSVNLFVNDDGLRLLDAKERQERIDFYTDNNIGWVARPPHGKDGFQRRGKFKKASNMNFALMVSCKIEEELAKVNRWPGWSNSEETDAYAGALHSVVDASKGLVWADGNIRMGDYILLVDSDTRVPRDCLLDAVSEMEQSPEVGIMQFSSGVMQVAHNFFENGITYFTNLIYSAIRYTVANGDVAPFVGHNAILRWSALQKVSYEDGDDYEKFWSESHVSEDFDMSLRLQCAGYIIRLASWAADGFKEGVSLTVYDELARWEKYAYGCNELLFHPIVKWPCRGPFTPLFRKFLTSGIPATSKMTVISYVGTYYAIGAAWILTSVNYFIKGWYGDVIDRYYVDSWQVWFSIIIVFNGLGNIGLAVMRYRVDNKSLLRGMLENMLWMPMLAIFLGGLSLHVSSAILAHMFQINMTWGATSKELEFSNFFLEVPKVIRKFKWSMIFSATFMIAMIIMAVGPFIPWGWEITDFVAILPMATVAASHMLLPIALNPALMTFSW